MEEDEQILKLISEEKIEIKGVSVGTQFRFLRRIENLINKYKELLKERDGIYADYQDLGKEKLKLEEKCEEQEKIIELMSRTIHYICLFSSQSKYVIGKYCKIYNSGNVGECEGLICSECVANYFIKKAKGE